MIKLFCTFLKSPGPSLPADPGTDVFTAEFDVEPEDGNSPPPSPVIPEVIEELPQLPMNGMMMLLSWLRGTL